MNINVIKMTPEMYKQTKIGRKSQTRRPLYKTDNNGQRVYLFTEWKRHFGWVYNIEKEVLLSYPVKYKVGETVRVLNIGDSWLKSLIKDIRFALGLYSKEVFIKIESIRYQSLFVISKNDAISEGIHFQYKTNEYTHELQHAPYPLRYELSYTESFLSLFKNIYGVDIYRKNPVVIVYEFALVDNDLLKKSK